MNSLKQLWSRLNLLSSRVGKIKDLIEQLQRYRRMNRPSKLPTCISIFSKPLELKFQIKTSILPIVSLPELPLRKKNCERARKCRPIRSGYRPVVPWKMSGYLVTLLSPFLAVSNSSKLINLVPHCRPLSVEFLKGPS